MIKSILCPGNRVRYNMMFWIPDSRAISTLLSLTTNQLPFPPC